MSKMTRLVTLLALACTVLSVQAVRAGDRASIAEAREASATFEINFLHVGSPKLMPVDLSRGVVFFQATANGRDVWVLLDNGAANTIIDAGLAAELGIKLDDSSADIRTPTGVLETQVARAVHLVVPNQMEFTADLYAADFSAVSARIDRPIGLVLGNDILSKMTFVVDSQFSRMLFVKSGAINLSGGNLQSLSYEKGTVDAVVAGYPAKLKLDFGSNHELTIFEHSWEKFFSGEDDGPRTATADATGMVRREPVRFGTRLDLGRFTSEVRTTRSRHPDTSVDGHIGFAYFLDKLVVVDEAAKKLTLVQREPEP